MVRQIRHKGGWYHITARGMGRRKIFSGAPERKSIRLKVSAETGARET
jgi:hypothetical protein